MHEPNNSGNETDDIFQKTSLRNENFRKSVRKCTNNRGFKKYKEKIPKRRDDFQKKIKSNEDFDVRRRKRRRINDYLETEPEYEEKIVEEEDRYEPSPQHQIEKSSRKRRKKDYSTTKLLKQQKIFVFITKPIIRKSQL